MQKLPKKGRDYGLDNLAGERFEVKVTVIISIVITSSVQQEGQLFQSNL